MTSTFGLLSYKDNVLHGVCTHEYIPGATKHKFNMRDGKRHGLFQSFHPNGNLKISATFIRGLVDGRVTFHKEDNGKCHSKYYTKNGMLEGEFEKSIYCTLIGGVHSKGKLTYVTAKSEQGSFSYSGGTTDTFEHRSLSSHVEIKCLDGKLHGPCYKRTLGASGNVLSEDKFFYSHGEWTRVELKYDSQTISFDRKDLIFEGTLSEKYFEDRATFDLDGMVSVLNTIQELIKGDFFDLIHFTP